MTVAQAADALQGAVGQGDEIGTIAGFPFRIESAHEGQNRRLVEQTQVAAGSEYRKVDFPIEISLFKCICAVAQIQPERQSGLQFEILDQRQVLACVLQRRDAHIEGHGIAFLPVGHGLGDLFAAGQLIRIEPGQFLGRLAGLSQQQCQQQPAAKKQALKVVKGAGWQDGSSPLILLLL